MSSSATCPSSHSVCIHVLHCVHSNMRPVGWSRHGLLLEHWMPHLQWKIQNSSHVALTTFLTAPLSSTSFVTYTWRYWLLRRASAFFSAAALAAASSASNCA